MINNVPLRLTTLHFAQRLRIDGDTFIITQLLNQIAWLPSQTLDYTIFSNFRPDFSFHLDRIKGLSGLEVLLR